MIEVYNEDAVSGRELNQSQARREWIEIGGFCVEADRWLRCEGFDCFPKFIGVLDYLVVH
jgi:hypothetical protein